jgi:hypothetical protein
MLIAALKFRFNECEKRKFSFKGLLKQSEKKRPHKVLSKEDLLNIDERLGKATEVKLACRLLYDLAGRC